MNLTVRQLKAFVLGAECRSFSEAANRLGITQPGYSLLIRQLEEETGLRLFERTTRRIELTTAGAELLSSARRTLLQLEETCQRVDDVRHARRGTLRLAVVPSVAYGLLPTALLRYRAACPQVRLAVLEARVVGFAESIRTGRAELGLGLLPEPDSELDFEPLLRDELVVLAHEAHELAATKSVRWRDLEGYDYISVSQHSSVRLQTDRVAAEIGMPLEPAYEAQTLTTVLGMVRARLGYGILPRLLVDSLNLTQMAVLPLVDPPAWRDIGLLKRRRSVMSPAAAAFAGLLRQEPAPLNPPDAGAERG